MFLSVLRTQLGGVLRRPGRLLLTGLSVLVAAFVVFGAVLADRIVTRTTLDTFSDTPPATDLVVRTAGAEPLGARQVAAVRHTAGVVEAVGRLTATVTVGDPSANTGLDVVADPGAGPLSRVTLVTGAYPHGPREVALDRRAAARLGADTGSVLRLRSGGPAVRVTVTGVVDGPRDSAERAYAPDSVVAAIGGARGYDRLDLRLTPGLDPFSVIDRLGGRLTADITTGDVVRENEARAAVRQFDQIVQLVTMVLASVVVAAALVATSTFRIVFARRLRQLALLRTIGARRGQLVRALAVEGALVGLVAGVGGVLLAMAAGLSAPAVAGAAGHPLSAPGLPVGAGLAVVVGAVALTVGAVLAPAFSAAGVAPLQALRDAGTAAAERGISTGRLLLGLLLTVATRGLVALAWHDMRLPRASAGVLLHLVGVGALAFGSLIVLGPLLIRPVLAAVGPPLRLLGPTGRLAVGGIGGAPRRAAAVSVVVALGVALVAGAVVGTSSLHTWTDRTMAARTPADLAMYGEERPIPDDVLARVRADRTFRAVTPFRIADFAVRDLSYSAIAVDLSALPTLASLETTAGPAADPRPGEVVLAHRVAEDLRVGVGDPVTLGRARLRVAGILTGEAPLRTDAVLTPADLARLGAPGSVATGVFADIADGSRDRAVAAFRRLGGGIGAEVAVLADERDRVDGEVSSLFAAALGLLGLTVAIAVVGVGTTTGLSVLERTRESALLRALGLSRPRLRAMIGMEAGLYGLIGAVLGLLLGVPLAWLSLAALRLDLPLTLPAGRLLVVVVALAAMTVLAGLLPARRAARVSPVAALAAAE